MYPARRRSRKSRPYSSHDSERPPTTTTTPFGSAAGILTALRRKRPSSLRKKKQSPLSGAPVAQQEPIKTQATASIGKARFIIPRIVFRTVPSPANRLPLTICSALPTLFFLPMSPESTVDRIEAEFRPSYPGFWKDVPEAGWNDWKWQLRNRITTLEGLERHLVLTPEERAGVILSGNKLALAVTPHYFNLIERDNPGCPIRRQIIPHVGEGKVSPSEMADPCGEDSHCLLYTSPSPRD